MISEHVVTSGQSDLHVCRMDTCTGTPIVFLHAGVADSRMWKGVMTALGDSHNLVAFDRRGFGRTQSPDEPFSHGLDLEAVIDELGADRVVLVGCSQGGRIALDFALAHPHRVKGLALVSTAVSGAPWPETFDQPIAAVVERWQRADDTGEIDSLNQVEARVWLDGPMATAGRVGGELRNQFLQMNRIALANDAANALTKEIEPESAMDRLDEITCPAWVVGGALDFPHIVSRSRQVADELRASIDLVGDVAHLVPFEQPSSFASLLRSFLTKLEESPGTAI